MKFFGLLIVVVLCIGGYWYFTHHQSTVSTAVNNVTDVKNTIVATTNAGIDSAVMSALQGVAKMSPVYYFQNRSYGISASQNICYDATSSNSLGSIIADIEQYTKAVTCVVDTDYPSRSFTLVAPSRTDAPRYYCTDQSGFVGLIPSILPGGAFRAGIKCK